MTRALPVYALWLAATLLLPSQPSLAGEPFIPFLEGLKRRGYLEEATGYLERMSAGTRVPDEVKRRIPYEMALVELERAKLERDSGQRTKRLDRAAAMFQEFAANNATSPLLPSVQIQLGSVLAARAGAALEQSERPENAARKQELFDQANAWFGEARQAVAKAEAELLEKIKSLPKDDPAVGDIREDLINARLKFGAFLFHNGMAYPAESAERKQLLQDAASKFNEVYSKYRNLVGGLSARLDEGRAYLELGETQKAIGILNEILAQSPEEPVMRRLQGEALQLAIPAMCLDTEKKFVEAAAAGQTWLATLKGAEAREPDALAVYYLTSWAIERQLAEAAKGGERPDENLKNEARDLAQVAARYPHPRQREARELLGRLRRGGATAKQDPGSFAEAYLLAEEAIHEMESRYQQASLAPNMDDAANIPKYEEEARQFGLDAERLLRLALSLRTPDVDMEQVNSARYYLAYANYRQGDYCDAAILGKFLARRYPQSSWARQGSKLALASYLAEYTAAAPGKRDYATRQMGAVAAFAAERWPGEPEADEAVMLLVELAVMEKKLDDALKYLERVPAGSPRRGEVEAKTGRALWGQYVASTRLDEATRPPQAELDALAQQARQLLASGVEKLTAEGRTPSVEQVAASLTLASIKLTDGDADGALALLTDQSFGALALAAASSPVVAEGNLKQEGFRTALRAYIAKLDFAKADEMLELLEKDVAAGGSAEADERLTAVLISLGRDLEQQIKQLRDTGQNERVAALSQGFESFLQRIASREQGNDFNSLNWVAGTFASLATGLDSGTAAASDEARPYFQQAAEVYRQIARKCQDGTFAATAPQRQAVTVRLAGCLRRLGQCREAVDLLVDVLKQNNQLLDAQQEAALALQVWGDTDAQYYDAAIRGHRQAQNKKGEIVNVIWGWAQLSRRVAGNAKYTDVYFDARYNLAKCRLKQYLSLKQSGNAEAAKRAVSQAAAEINIQYRQTPAMGGPAWLQKFDALLRTIQQVAGERPTGLPTPQPTASRTGIR